MNYYLSLYNRKHVKSSEHLLIANSEMDAQNFYLKNKDTLPKHTYYDISEYAVDKKPLEIVE